MDKLVGKLLTLTRLEALPGHAMDELVDVADMVEQIAAHACFEAGPAGPPIRVAAAALTSSNSLPSSHRFPGRPEARAAATATAWA